MLRSQKGFTLIEIIAVLVILGILAAVAVPRYLDLTEDARQMAAKGAIGEMKGRLSQAQAKYMLKNSGALPDGATLYTYAADANQFGGNLTNVGPDFNVTLTTAAPLTITVDKVQSNPLKTAVTDTFTAAGD